jgi:hypothetical protein
VAVARAVRNNHQHRVKQKNRWRSLEMGDFFGRSEMVYTNEHKVMKRHLFIGLILTAIVTELCSCKKTISNETNSSRTEAEESKVTEENPVFQQTNIKLEPIPESSRIKITFGRSDIDTIRLWVPEAVNSDTGTSAVYPVGQWTALENGGYLQRISGSNIVGPGNCPKIDENTFECVGIKIPADNPVEWTTAVFPNGDEVHFEIELHNLGKTILRKAGAGICLSFEKAEWWSDENTFAISDGRVVSLSELGRDAGTAEGFEAWLLKGQTYNHIFLNKFWGINKNRIDKACMVSEHSQAGICVGIESETAYFMHSNLGNPCTDVMLAFGDIGPGDSAKAKGKVWIREGTANQLLSNKLNDLADTRIFSPKTGSLGGLRREEILEKRKQLKVKKLTVKLLKSELRSLSNSEPILSHFF